MESKIRPILEAIRKGSFTPDYRAAATDEELLGLLLSRHFEWDGVRILRAAYAALEDANFHSDNEVIQGLIDKYTGVAAAVRADAESASTEELEAASSILSREARQ